MRTFADTERKAPALTRSPRPRSAAVIAMAMLLSASAWFAPSAHGQSGYALCQLIQSVSPGDTYPVDNPGQIKPGVPNYSCNESPTENGAFVSLLHFSSASLASTSDFRAGQWNGTASGLGNSDGTAEDSNLSVVFFRRNCFIAEVSSTDAAMAQRVAMALDGKLEPLPCAGNPATPPPAAVRSASYRLACDKGLPLPLVIGAEPSQPCTLWIYDWPADVRLIEVLFPDKVDSYGSQPDGIRISTVGEGAQSTSRMSGSYRCPESGHDRCFGWGLLVEAMRQTAPGAHTSRIQVGLNNAPWTTLKLNTVAGQENAPPIAIPQRVVPQQDITGTWVDEDGTQVTISNSAEGTTLMQYRAADRYGIISGRYVGSTFKGTYVTRNSAGRIVATGTQALTLTLDGFFSGPWASNDGRKGSFNLTRLQRPIPSNPSVPQAGPAGNQAANKEQFAGKADITGAWVGSSGIPATISSAGSGSVVIQFRQPAGNGIISGTWSGSLFQGTYVTQDDTGRVVDSGTQTLTLNENGDLSGPWQSSEGRSGIFTLVRPAVATLAKSAPPNPVQQQPAGAGTILGTWYREGDRGRPASIQQSSGGLILTNEAGGTVLGQIQNGAIVADGWGGLVGKLVKDGTRINWSNGTTWQR